MEFLQLYKSEHGKNISNYKYICFLNASISILFQLQKIYKTSRLFRYRIYFSWRWLCIKVRKMFLYGFCVLFRNIFSIFYKTVKIPYFYFQNSTNYHNLKFMKFRSFPEMKNRVEKLQIFIIFKLSHLVEFLAYKNSIFPVLRLRTWWKLFQIKVTVSRTV